MSADAEMQFCERCLRPIIDGRIVWLELDQRISRYHDYGGVPEHKSQGCFPFGADCADVERRRANEQFKKLDQA
jgi:hypothetical protein